MSYATANRRYWERQWVGDEGEVVEFGRAMVEAGYMTDVEDLMCYFEEPHKWTYEHVWWVANDRTDDSDVWDAGMFTGWEL